jgi:hypothetical protein
MIGKNVKSHLLLYENTMSSITVTVRSLLTNPLGRLMSEASYLTTTFCSKSHEETMVSHWLIDSSSSALACRTREQLAELTASRGR